MTSTDGTGKDPAHDDADGDFNTGNQISEIVLCRRWDSNPHSPKGTGF